MAWPQGRVAARTSSPARRGRRGPRAHPPDRIQGHVDAGSPQPFPTWT